MHLAGGLQSPLSQGRVVAPLGTSNLIIFKMYLLIVNFKNSNHMTQCEYAVI